MIYSLIIKLAIKKGIQLNQKIIIPFILILIVTIIFNSNLYSQSESVKIGSLTSENSSKILTYDLPEKLIPGKDYTSTVTMLNNGKNKWTKSDNYYLGIYSENDTDSISDL